ncbi:MAG TPA: adenosylcobalamin-dependent ribonucleoside-diphosphate reductase, partial [bacterium]|nr:adenosylcobalamin-dependent ribonucleoside-diphosphate reductase [bacterium]
MVEYIKKRDGSIVEFLPEKIEFAIYRALKSENIDDLNLAIKLTEKVIEKIDKEKIPTVEEVQDIVENVLVENGFYNVAKAYILYREKRKQIRESKKILGVEDKLKLSINAINVLRKRYLLRDEKGEIIETPEEMFRRVAKYVASCEKEKSKYEEEFFNIMANLEFLPNSPTLMNAGTPLGQLSACFVLPVDDSIDGIFTTLKNMALIHKSGGGTGFSFSKLRPKGDIVGSTKGVASGPVSFMEIYDKATEIVKQGGKRRGANMGILSYNHPDIYEFITSKRKNILTNFNISVSASDEFMEKVIKKEKYSLINPRNGEKVRDVYADEIFDLICQSAWETGDPGIIYIDEINRHNPTPEMGKIEVTNPCGETPLLFYESCNLGSINLTKIIEDGRINWEKLEKIIEIAVRFLDDVIDANNYPIPEIEKATKGNRKIGLGIMGWADLLLELKIPYGSDESFILAEELRKFINEKAF